MGLIALGQGHHALAAVRAGEFAVLALLSDVAYEKGMRYDRTVIAYHGCDAELAAAVLGGETTLQASENDYDWLGRGIYFWEFGADRAFRFAQD